MTGNSALIILGLVAVVLLMYIWDAFIRPRLRSSGEPSATPARARPADRTPSPKTAASSPSTPAAPAEAPTPARLQVDPNDPLVQRSEAIAAQIQAAFASVDGLPATLDDRVALRAAVMAAERVLDDLRASMATSDPSARQAIGEKLDRLERQISSARASARSIAASYTDLSALLAALPAGIAGLLHQLDALAGEPTFPIVLSRGGPLSAARSSLAEPLPTLADARNHDALKQQLLRARQALGDIAAGHQALAAATTQRAQVAALLSSPELAAQPEWHRAIALLCRRAPGDPAATALGAEADALLERRRALTAGLRPDGAGGYRLDEDRLPQLAGEAAAIQHDVRDAWGRARALAAARTSAS